MISGESAKPLTLDDHPANKVVECAAHVLNGIPGDQRKFNGDRGQIAHIVSHLPRLRIILGGDFAWIGFPGGNPAGLEISDMLIGPFQLGDDAIECRTSHP